MQLNKFTDLGVRVLLVLNSSPNTPTTIGRLAEMLQVSKNHLMKVVHFMSKEQWVSAVRGKNGGITLAHPPETYRIGEIIQTLEEQSLNGNRLINCHEPPCVLIPSCQLQGYLVEAINQFYDSLNQYTLPDLSSSESKEHIISLHQLTSTLNDHLSKET